MSRLAPLRAALSVLALLAAGAAAAAPDFEPFPPAKASASLPPELRKGETFTVREDGVTEGFLTRWEMESSYGLFACPSRRLLEVRAREVQAMAKVVESDPTNEALKGLQARLKDIPTAMIDLIDDPAGTLERAGEGAKRTLGRVGGLFSKRKGTAYEDGETEALLLAGEKRKVAAELGVDVYSSNPKLQTFLGDIAKARRAGAFAVDLARLAVPGGAGVALLGLTATADLTALLRDHTPAELDEIADEAMAKAGVAPDLRRRFLSTRALSPRHRTVIARAVAGLAGVANAGALVAAAAETGSEAQAFLHEQQALALAAHHESVEPLAALDATGGLVAAFTRSGKMLVPVPVDVVALVPELPSAVDALLSMPGAAQAPSRTVWLTGTATPRAVEYLRARGFDVVPNASLPAGEAR